MPDEAWQRLEEFFGRHDDLPVLRSHRACRQPGVGEFIHAGLREADGKGSNRVLDQRCHQGCECARIKTAGKEEPQRDITHEVAVDHRLQSTPQLVRP